jgi:putative endonuclease
MPQAGTEKRRLGDEGEALAQRHLRGGGYTVVETNWRCRHGEIDIIARQGDTWVFVEVRTRHAHSTEAAFASLLPAKQKRMAACAQAYLTDHGLENAAWRVDVIAIARSRSATPVIEHAQDALAWD